MTTHPGTLLFPPAVVLTVLFAMAQGVREDTIGYWVGLVSSATVFTVFSCTYAALSAALVAGRLRRSRLLHGANTRSPLSIAWIGVWPIVSYAALMQLTGLIIASSQSWGAPGRFPWEVVGAWCAMILLHTSIGFLIGLSAPAFVSAPLALVISYVWLGFTWSGDFIPLRYLAGFALSGCCAVYATLPFAAPLAVIVFSVGVGAVIVGVINASQSRNRAVWFSVLAASTVPVAALSVWIAGGLGYYPSPPRETADLQCETRNGTDVCLFPEQRWNTTIDPTAVIATTLRTLEHQGYDVPDRVSGAIVEPSAETVWLVYRSNFSVRTTVTSLVSSLVPQRQEGEACPRDDQDPDRMFQISDVVSRELLRAATGASSGDLDTFTGSAELDAVMSELTRLDAPSRVEWVNAAVRALRDCGLPYPTLNGATR